MGAIGGAIIANNISGNTLRSIVGIFLLILAIQLIINHKLKEYKNNENYLLSILSGSGIGAASAIVGIGGGSFSVPYLRTFGYEM